ncbi:hypothetical protein AAF712_006268 [Marasmius tenuissimus]|uniref:Uncharacterized protein n=1 Tax=Marasmius tenuissimus TaxID=585030 RepID=A0ABR2ZZG4_9AGAR
MITPAESNTPLFTTPPASTPPLASTSTPSETVSAPSTQTQTKRFRTAAERKAQLERDPWIDSTKVTPKKVRCLGCGNDVKLDMRAGADYYPAPWNKHKAACAYIKEGKRKGDEESGEKGGRGANKVATADQPATLPVAWTTASLEGGGLTMQSSGDLLRAMGNQGEFFWGSRPSTPGRT